MNRFATLTQAMSSTIAAAAKQDPERPRGGAEHLVEQRTDDGAVLLDDPGVPGRAAEALRQAAGQRRQLRGRRRRVEAPGAIRPTML